MPLFSIVIPTRNRAYLLRYALQSALAQTFDDYEILVSNNNCTDNTEEVVREIGSDRVRYIRTDKTLSMPDHWDFALSQVRGEYVTYLCDDDAFCPNLLEKAEQEIKNSSCQLLSWNFGRYFHPTWHNLEERNMLVFPHSFSNKVQYFDSASDLVNLFAFKLYISDARHPRMLNSFCNRNILDKIRNRVGRVFIPSCPDYSVCALTLALTKFYAFLDEPLAIYGGAPESIGASSLYKIGKASSQFFEEFEGEDFLGRVPLKLDLVINYIVDTLLSVKEQMGAALLNVQVDWGEYFIRSYEHIMFAAKYGGQDVAQAQAEFFKTLSKQPFDIQGQVQEWVAKTYPPVPATTSSILKDIKRITRGIIQSNASLMKIESRVRQKRLAPVEEAADPTAPRFFRGEDYGCSNIVDWTLRLENLRQKA